MKRTVVCILLLLAMLLAGCAKESAPSAEDNATSAQSGEPMHAIVQDGKSDYVIVAPKGDDLLLAKAYILATKISVVTGVSLPVVTDVNPEQEKEILMGNTAREIELQEIDRLRTPDDYLVVRRGEKILLMGDSAEAMDGAIAYLEKHCIGKGAKGYFGVPETLCVVQASDKEYLTVDDSYVIVAKESERAYAETVQAALQEHAGLSLAIRQPSESDGEREILIGDADRAAGKEASGSITTSFEGVLCAVGNRLVLTGKTESVIRAAAEQFAEEIEGYLFRGRFMIPADYRKTLNLGDAIAPEILTSITFNNVKWDTSVKNDEYTVYLPDGTESGYYYSHHQFIAEFKDKLYIFYSNGRRNEDDCGQRIMMAVSEDGGKTWRNRVLVEAPKASYNSEVEAVLYCIGVYVYEDTMNVYYNGWEWTEECLVYNPDGSARRPAAGDPYGKIQLRAKCIQTTDGETFGKPIELGKINGGNMSPKRYQTPEGKEILLWAGYGSLSYTEDLTGVSGWQNIKLELSPDTGTPKAISEASIYQLSDGTLIHMSRSGGGCSLAAASFDGGYTWTDMYISSFRDFVAKFEFGTLPDGRYYYVGNLSTQRAELVVMISEDGMNFTEGYYLGGTAYKGKEGLYKGGNYGYPTTYIDGEYMYIVYSKDKEMVGVTRVALSELGCR